MSYRQATVEANLKRAAARWKWLRFAQHTATLGGLVTLLILLLGFGMTRGWFTSTIRMQILLVGLGLLTGVAWLVVTLIVWGNNPERGRLANLLEKGQPRLLDRLNTLIFLEKRNPSFAGAMFYKRIAKQAQGVLTANKAPLGLPKTRALVHGATFAALLFGTIYFYHRFTPWDKLRATALQQALARPAEAIPDLALPDVNSVEQKKDWGEVRITDPGKDLKLTKVDVVALQIEAAAHQTLTNVGWITTVNAGAETPHPLPPPAEPRYAVYQPLLYLDELKLTDWDVLTYYANAQTDHGNHYASEVFFLEVRPFREDILKMPGGEGGSAYQCLSQLTDLINRQQHIIRQTHRHLQTPPEATQPQAQDRRKLADAESDLSDATKHLYAEMAVKMENKPIGEVLDQLAQAEAALKQASGSLRDNQMPAAQNQERAALQQLIATRKNFQKTISEHPKDFEDAPPEEQAPLAEAKDKLAEIAEFRNEAKAAQEFVKQAVREQTDIARRVGLAARTNYAQLAQEEKQLQQALEDFQAQHPQVFKGVTNEAGAAGQALQQAATALEKRAADARRQPPAATEKLEQLSQALENQMTGQQLAAAYQLKQLLDEQIKTLDQAESQPDALPAQALQKTAGQAKATTDELKQLAEKKPTSEAFGEPLRDALSDANKQALDQKLSELAQASGSEERQQKAGVAKAGLEKVSQAFQKSQPQVLQEAKTSDALNAGQPDAFERGMAQLESLLRQLQAQRPISPEDQSKQRREALQNLQTGIEVLYGANEKSQALLLLLERELKAPGHEVDPVTLKKLMAELTHFSAEVKDPVKPPDDPAVTSMDPARFPPAYRGRIEEYFKKLSESK